jgi:hypothetical protein
MRQGVINSRLSAALLISILASPASGGPFGWATQEQMSVASQLGAAHASANLCNHEIDEVGTARVIRTRIAQDGKLTPEMAADLMKMIVGLQAMQVTLLNTARMDKQRLAEHCATMLSNFGPNGSQLKGVLKP